MGSTAASFSRTGLTDLIESAGALTTWQIEDIVAAIEEEAGEERVLYADIELSADGDGRRVTVRAITTSSVLETHASRDETRGLVKNRRRQKPVVSSRHITRAEKRTAGEGADFHTDGGGKLIFGDDSLPFIPRDFEAFDREGVGDLEKAVQAFHQP